MSKTEEKRLNKFEMTRLLSARALELSEGDKPKVKTSGKRVPLTQDYVGIAEEEFKTGKLDLDVYRDK